MKKILSLFLVIIILFTCCGCSFHKTTFTSLKDYGEFRKDKYRVASAHQLFPQKLNDSWNVEDYEFCFRSSLMFDDIYIFLNVSFNDQDYKDELNRIMNLENSFYSGGKIVEDNIHFQYQAFVLAYGYTCEYALNISEENRIVYVYLYKTDISYISFPREYLPKVYVDSQNEYYA